jgi:hypothetical protein
MKKPEIDQGGTTANMTMRQYYAGIALPSVIAKALGGGLTVDPAIAEIYSRDAFRWADAMIKASRKE